MRFVVLVSAVMTSLCGVACPLVTSDVADAGPLGGASDAGVVNLDELLEDVRVRVAAANLTSGNLQSWDLGHGSRILQGIKPDVALLQELNVGGGSTNALRAFIDETFGEGFAVFRQQGAQIPNAVVSRWPIIEGGVWDDTHVSNRDHVYARIDIPGERDLWAVSVHLLTENATTRASEASELLDYIAANVPDEDLLVIGGDLNTTNEGEAALDALDNLVSLAHSPVDQDGQRGTSADRSRRLDWVLPDDDLEALHIPVVVGDNTFPDGLVLDTRSYTPLSDLAPALEADSAAPSMQHMAVVRDFLLVAP